MKAVLIAGAMVLCGTVAQANIPTMNAVCPTGVNLHVDAG